MVNFINCERDEFINRVKNKDIYCFGSGKYLKDFSDSQYQILIKGVIDNYCSDKVSVSVNDQIVEIISADEFQRRYNNNCVVVITSSYFREILQQLDSIEIFDGMDCYIELFIRQYKEYEYENKYLESRFVNNQNKMKNLILHKSNKKKFQIWECLNPSNIAGSKAPNDISIILEREGYFPINIHPYKEMEGQVGYNWGYRKIIEDWNNCYLMIPPNSILFLQYPFCQIQKERNRVLLQLKNEKKIKIVTLVHDVEKLRKIFFDEYREIDFDFILQISDILIVHNNNMIDYFLQMGINQNLEIFDYLCSNTHYQKYFERSITIAGNLDKLKSPYIEKLEKFSPLKIHLYGPNYFHNSAKKEENSAISYHGSFSSDKIPHVLDRGFGLVWDGDSLNTCSGPTGEYLKYNNPHKLSLYLAAGLPVIIWKKAAKASFVEKYKLGFTVDSLYEIPEILNHIDEGAYEQYLNHVKSISNKLKKGEYTRQAIKTAENY